jgi:hypothetical protein
MVSCHTLIRIVFNYMKVKINVYDVKHIGGQLAFFGSGMLAPLYKLRCTCIMCLLAKFL